MCCNLQYKDGVQTIIIKGFNTVKDAVDHCNERGINDYFLRVTSEEG